MQCRRCLQLRPQLRLQKPETVSEEVRTGPARHFSIAFDISLIVFFAHEGERSPGHRTDHDAITGSPLAGRELGLQPKLARSGSSQMQWHIARGATPGNRVSASAEET